VALEVEIDVLLVYVDVALEVESDVLLVYVDVALEVETDVLLVAEDVTLAVNVDVPLSDIDVLPALDAEEAVLPCQVEELAVEEAVVVVLELVNDEVIVAVLVVSTGAMPSIPCGHGKIGQLLVEKNHVVVPRLNVKTISSTGQDPWR